MKNLLLITLLYSISLVPGFTQTDCGETEMVIVTGNSTPVSSYALGMPSNVGGTLKYCPIDYNHELGGHYYLNYIDGGGSGMDGYPNIKIGGSQYGGQWHPGEFDITGMPVMIKNIHQDMVFEWKCKQLSALDDNDKWMASINFIFDMYGDETSKPISSERDFDLVVKAQSHNFNDFLDDQPAIKNNIIYFFARHADGSLKPYTITLNDKTYTYAVRYKFFSGTADKDDKAHVKLIPYGVNGAPEVLVMNVNNLIKGVKDLIQFANIPEPYKTLAENNIAGEDTWLKAINAGYEVYTGQSQLNIERFKVWPQGQESTAVSDLFISHVKLYPNPASEKVQVQSLTPIESIRCYNLVGKEMMINYQHNSFVVSHLKPGYYFIQIKDKKGGSLVKKLFVKG